MRFSLIFLWRKFLINIEHNKQKITNKRTEYDPNCSQERWNVEKDADAQDQCVVVDRLVKLLLASVICGGFQSAPYKHSDSDSVSVSSELHFIVRPAFNRQWLEAEWPMPFDYVSETVLCVGFTVFSSNTNAFLLHHSLFLLYQLFTCFNLWPFWFFLFVW